MVMQLRRPFGRRFEPRSGEHGGGGADDNRLTGIRTADLKLCSGLRYHSTGVRCDSNGPPHCLEPSEQKLLTTTPHPHPLKKLISSFRG